MSDSQDQESVSSLPLTKPQGKESVIAPYCRKKITSGLKNCILVCQKRGKRYNLVDIPFHTNADEIVVLGLQDLRKLYSRWKRHSLYSPVEVKEVMTRVIHFDEKSQRISVVITNFDCTDDVAELERKKKEDIGEIVESEECGLNVDGHYYDHREDCDNCAWDEVYERLYCKVKRIDSVELRVDSYRWLSSLLEYYWHNGIDAKGKAFLRKAGFVYRYDELIYDQYFDAAKPYGKTINAFLVVEGWDVKLLIQLIGGCVFLTIGIVSVVTLVSSSFETGLTAGGYAASLLAIVLGAFTLLSMIM